MKSIKEVKKHQEAAINTRDKIAELAGVSHDTVYKVKKIEEFATEKIKQQLRNNDISINKAYKQVKKQAEGRKK